MSEQSLKDTIFTKELKELINRHSRENASNTPDFILAQYLWGCLLSFETAVQQRETYYGRDARPSWKEPSKPPEAKNRGCCDGCWKYPEQHGCPCHESPPTPSEEREKAVEGCITDILWNYTHLDEPINIIEHYLRELVALARRPRGE